MTNIVTSEQMADFLGYAQQVVDADYAIFSKCFAHPTPPTLVLDKVTKRTKYVRIFTDNGTQRMVWGFIRLADGDVLKATGWKAPALNFARGNIFDADHGLSRAPWTGVA